MNNPLGIWVIGLFFALQTSSCTKDSALSDVAIDNGEPCQEGIIYFPLDILPVLEANCAFGGCHDAITKEEGVQLDNYINVIVTGGINPKNPDKSELFSQIKNKSMPPAPYLPLDTAQVNLIEKWIDQGARNLTCTPEGSCPTTDVSFANRVFPILTAKCLTCHGAGVFVAVGGGVDLSDYNAVKTQALNGRLFGSISHSPNYKPMPQGVSQLPVCEINQIKSWIDAGAPNN